MQLIHGDCLQEMKKIPDHSVDLILADLPYGTTACSWDIVIPFEPLWEQYKRVRKEKSATVLFGTEPFSSLLRVSNLKEYKYDWVWDKVTARGHLVAPKRPMQQTEVISVFGEGEIKYYPIMINRPLNKIEVRHEYKRTEIMGGAKNLGLPNKTYTQWYPKNLLQFSNAKSSLISVHLTQKPTSLLEYLIKTYTHEGDLVLDNVMGSGSTGIACLNTNRDFIGIELYPLPDKPISKTNPDYFGITQRRIAKWKFEPADDPTSEKINLF